MAVLLIKPANAPAEGTPGRDVVLRVGRAEALLAQKKFEEARASYKSLVEEYPEYPNIHYAFGRLLLELNTTRSEEHTSELQSQSNLVCRLLLEKKKTHINQL